MKKPAFLSLAAVASVGLFLPFSLASAQSIPAQSMPSASALLGAVDALETVNAARENVLNEINLQFAQVTEEVRNLPSQPRNTVNEQESFNAEIAAIAARLGELSAAVNTVNQIQAAEDSLFATLQADMHDLGL